MGKATEGGVIDARKLAQIRRRFDEYTRAGGPAYKAFMYNAHSDVGALLDMVDVLRQVRCYDGEPCITGGCTEPCKHIP